LVPKAEIAILTEDPMLYAELARMLKEQGIDSVSLFPGEKVPRGIRVVLTSRAEEGSVAFPTKVIARKGRTLETWTLLQTSLGVISPQEHLRIGIDPGPRPGFAIVTTTGQCVASGILNRPEAAASLARGLRETLPEAVLRFCVGSGDRLQHVRVVNELLQLRFDVEIVDERGSTPHGRRNNDTASARWIASQSGRLVTHPLSYPITPGEVREVQRRSRELSGGRYTIPREMASRVLAGEISLDSAVRKSALLHSNPPRLPLKKRERA
jgi:hypothetical protein